MVVFKSFLLSIKQDRWVILIYAVIFLALSIANIPTIREQSQEQFVISRPHILLIDESPDSAFSQALAQHLNQIAKVEPLSLAYDEATLRIAADDGDLLVRVPSDIETRLQHDGAILDIYYETGSSAGSLGAMEVEKFLRYVDAYRKFHGTMDYEAIAKGSEQVTQVQILSTPTTTQDADSWFRFYIVFFHYIYIAIALHVVVPIVTMLNEQGLRTRRMLSSLLPRDYFAQMFLGISLFFVAILTFFLLFGLIVMRFEVSAATLGILLLDLLVFTVSLASFLLALSSLRLSRQGISAIANAFSMIVAFVSGIFVPADFLPSFVVDLSKFFPAYHSVQVVKNVGLEWGQIAYYLGMQLLFAVVFALIAVYFSRSRRQNIVRTT